MNHKEYFTHEGFTHIVHHYERLIEVFDDHFSRQVVVSIILEPDGTLKDFYCYSGFTKWFFEDPKMLSLAYHLVKHYTNCSDIEILTHPSSTVRDLSNYINRK